MAAIADLLMNCINSPTNPTIQKLWLPRMPQWWAWAPFYTYIYELTIAIPIFNSLDTEFAVNSV